MLKLSQTLLALAIISQLSGCVTAVVGGAAAGTAIATDRRTSGIYIEDTNIELKAERKMSETLGDDAHVNVTSYNRIVLLTGEVPDQAAKAKAETILKTMPNIRSIANELHIGPKTEIGDWSNDTYITTKVKANFLADKRFSFNHIKVVTERNVVHLMGLVKTSEADAAVEIASKTEGVKKVIKLFEHLP